MKSVISTVVVIAVIIFSAVKVLPFFHENAVRKRPLLPVTFDHKIHTDTGCITCHHNFADDTGSGSCYSCHKFTPEISPQIETMFHDLCRNCHIEKRIEATDAGPMRRCSLCHRTPSLHLVQ